MEAPPRRRTSGQTAATQLIVCIEITSLYGVLHTSYDRLMIGRVTGKPKRERPDARKRNKTFRRGARDIIRATLVGSTTLSERRSLLRTLYGYA